MPKENKSYSCCICEQTWGVMRKQKNAKNLIKLFQERTSRNTLLRIEKAIIPYLFWFILQTILLQDITENRGD